MKILHITDYHFLTTGSNLLRQDKIINSIIEELQKEKNINFLFFTGDLVYQGSNSDNFKKASDSSIEKIISAIIIRPKSI